MAKRTILYLTTNPIWGGSEVLWTQSAKRMREEGFSVKAAGWYDYGVIREFLGTEQDYFQLTRRYSPPSLFRRIAQKAGLGKYEAVDHFYTWARALAPDLVVLSQGNSLDGKSLMECCRDLQLPFVTVTHLVMEGLWPALDEERMSSLRELYQLSKWNFFVSKHCLSLHEKLLGEKFSNAGIIYNPFIKTPDPAMPFPVVNGQYKIALVGRLETYHKGYDLLIDVIRQEKWRKRNIRFSIYGKGPHAGWLRRQIDLHGINNLIIKEHVEEVGEIWREHHLLLMPSRMEGQSLTLIEAMRFKRAAVVTAVGGTEELIEEGLSGFIAGFPAPGPLDEALERAWNRRDEWEQMGRTAFAFISGRHPADATAYFNEKLLQFLE